MTRPERRRGIGAALLGAALCIAGGAGCAGQREPILAAFPRAAMASPWVLRGTVWSGAATDAVDAIGSDWAKVAPLEPARVWLALYDHENGGGRALRVRAYQLPTVERAAAFVDERREQDSEPLAIGDRGAWMADGVAFARGRVAFEIIGDGPEWGAQLQAAYLGGCIDSLLAKGAPRER